MTKIASVIALATVLLTASPSFAQWASPLRSASAAKEFCSHSVAADGTDEAYESARRQAAQRPVEVWLSARDAPVIEYDRVTGALELGLYRPAKFVDGYAVAATSGTVGFELTEVEAQKLWARYESGTAKLKITFLPLAWSDYDKPFCRAADDLQVLDGEILTAQLVDEGHRTLATYVTPLGREVALMRQHRIKGYLDSGTPIVTVSALTHYPAQEDALEAGLVRRTKGALRSATYGCYLRGLSSNARLQGALVLRLHPSERSTVLVDSLHDPQTRACALKRITELQLAVPGALKATIIFRLEESPGL